ncbi:SDR family NAD(P)-dependent oxidoreductase [Nocardia sp. NPDC003345]
MSDLTNKVALVTGASSGLGASTAQLFDERGATVFGVARDEQRLTEVFADMPRGRFTTADLSAPAACAAVVQECVGEFGRIDVLVNVAGSHTMRHTTSMTEDDWNHDLAVNLNAPFFLCHAALPHLLESGGNIVNVASIAGLQGQAYSAGYCAAKHGLVGLTRALAVEFTARRLRVNAVCPGGMLTPQVTGFSFPEGADPNLILRTAAPRGMNEPREIAAMIAFLAGDEASAIHGAVIAADNGTTAG